jgi:hypothetical protein
MFARPCLPGLLWRFSGTKKLQRQKHSRPDQRTVNDFGGLMGASRTKGASQVPASALIAIGRRRLVAFTNEERQQCEK